MMNCSTVLVQNTWGVHLNFEGQFSSPPSFPSWLTQLQQQDWQRRGIVVWNAELRLVAHLYAGYALELLEHLQETIHGRLMVWSSARQFSNSPPAAQTTRHQRWEELGYWKIK
jgi:hypothetical protein